MVSCQLQRAGGPGGSEKASWRRRHLSWLQVRDVAQTALAGSRSGSLFSCSDCGGALFRDDSGCHGPLSHSLGLIKDFLSSGSPSQPFKEPKWPSGPPSLGHFLGNVGMQGSTLRSLTPCVAAGNSACVCSGRVVSRLFPAEGLGMRLFYGVLRETWLLLESVPFLKFKKGKHCL